MHTYVTDGTTYTVGFLMIQKTTGVHNFVPLFDVVGRTDAVIAVNALNGGDAKGLRQVNIIKEYIEGVSPQPAAKDLGGL